MFTHPAITATEEFTVDASRVGLDRRTRRNPISAMASGLRSRLAARRLDAAWRRRLASQHELSRHSNRMRAEWDSHFMGF